MSTELFWLVATVFMTALFWTPYIINRMVEMGVFHALWHPQPDPGAKALWAKRMMLAHDNAVENLVIFVPLVLVVELTGSATEYTALAAQVYFFARLAHFLVFSFAIPLLRVITFLVGFGAQMVLVTSLFGSS